MGSTDVAGAVMAGKFRLERALASGASAVVWEATHVVTGRVVALKVCDLRRGQGERQRARWLREARAASRVSHPNLLPIEDVLELEDGRAVLVMERLLGQSLRERIAQGPLAVDEVERLFVPVIEALAEAHAAGIVHRDLKPDNLFLTRPPERLVVLDFGVAKLASDDDLGLTSTGTTVGTPFYMAPEQLFGEDDVDARADVWSLGVVLHECLTGHRPIEAANLGQLLKRIHAGAIRKLEAADLPARPALAVLLARTLEPEREARPTLAALREGLLAPADAAPHEPLPASSGPASPSPERTSPPVQAAASTPPPALAVSTSTARRPGSRGWLGALAVGALLAGGIWVGVTKAPPAPTRAAAVSAVSAVEAPAVSGGGAYVASAPGGSEPAASVETARGERPSRREAPDASATARAAVRGTESGRPPVRPAASTTAVVVSPLPTVARSEPRAPQIVQDAPF